MPHIAITMIPGRDERTKMDLAKKAQAFLVAELSVDPRFVSVSVEDIPMTDWEKSMEKFPEDILFVKPGGNADGGKPNMMEKKEQSIFPIGEKNDAYAPFFIGQSYLAPLSTAQVGIFNVTFEPGCRNNWHIHKAEKGGGQILLCVSGQGWYQEWGREAQKLLPGDVVNIPAGVKHWHGAAADRWFSHLAVEVPGEGTGAQWLEPVDETQYGNLK